MVSHQSHKLARFKRPSEVRVLLPLPINCKIMQQLYEYLFGVEKKLKRPLYTTTLDEFCDNNDIDIDNINEHQLEVFYCFKNEDSHVANAKEKFLTRIVESLTSHSGKKLAEKLQKIIGVHGTVAFYETNKPHTIIAYLNDDYLLHKSSLVDFTLNDTKESELIYYMLNMFFYHISEIGKRNGNTYVIIEPRYSEDVTKTLRNKTNIFYHITLKSNVDKILKRGLTPKVGKTRKQGGYRYFPEKVFLIADSENIIDDVNNIISTKEYGDSYSIIKIDLTGHNVGLYVDNYYESENIVYTYEAIPPSLLSVVEFEDL